MHKGKNTQVYGIFLFYFCLKLAAVFFTVVTALLTGYKEIFGPAKSLKALQQESWCRVPRRYAESNSASEVYCSRNSLLLVMHRMKCCRPGSHVARWYLAGFAYNVRHGAARDTESMSCACACVSFYTGLRSDHINTS